MSSVLYIILILNPIDLYLSKKTRKIISKIRIKRKRNKNNDYR